MLNELYELSKALEHHNLLQSTTHPNMHSVGKTHCLLIELDIKGVPQAARLLQKDETGRLWTHRRGGHNSFPAVRVQKPLLAAAESGKIDNAEWNKAKISEKIKLLQKLDFHAINPESTDIRISDWSLGEFGPVLSSTQPELQALRQLINVFPRKQHCGVFSASLASFLKRKIEASDSEAEVSFIKELLVGSFDAKKNKYVAGCMTYYDVHETAVFPNLASSMTTRQALIAKLNNSLENCSSNHNRIVCPLSGKQAETIGDKYPNPNIPLLGQTYLYSKKLDIRCLTRYHMSGTDAFRAGKAEVEAIHDAISFLTDKTRRNKSWTAMSDHNRDRPNLLLAYLPNDPQNNAYLAQILGDPSDYDSANDLREQTEFTFDALCQQVLGNIEDVIRKNPLTTIKLILLETLDPGRKQVVYEASLTAERFRQNLLMWVEATENQPNIAIRVRDKKKMTEYKPICPGPNGICQLLKINYTSTRPSKSLKQSAVSLPEIYYLYMPPNDVAAHNESFLIGFLGKVIGTTGRMLGDAGHWMTMEYALPSEKEFHLLAKRASSSVSLISILLWRLGVRKEKYMLDAPFNVGQFLQLSDMLHKEYSVQVRNGGNRKAPLPSQLMGNEMLVIASENPVEGLNRLRERMKIYLAWANTATGENAGIAKWILARYGEISAKIAADGLPEEYTPAEQAQVLLGYLATIPYEKKN